MDKKYMSSSKIYPNKYTNAMDVSLALDPNKLQNYINEKSLDVEQQSQQTVHDMQEDAIGEDDSKKLPPECYGELPWTIGVRNSNRHSIRSMKEGPTIASPFMPIAAQIPIEYDKRITVPHTASAPRECRGGYGSIRVKVEERKLQKKPNESSSEIESNSDEESTDSAKLSSLTTKEWMTICILATANLGSTTVYSCIAPFYPNEANIKGLSSFETGIVFGIFELVMFLTAPVFGRYMAYIGSKKMFVSGITVTAVTAILFGFLNAIESPSLFFWTSVSVRIAEALGDAAFVTSSFAIGAKCFPGRIATIVGIMETFAGLGYTAGPPLGGILYEIGGFQLPFTVLGIILLIVAILAYFLVETMDDDTTLNGKGMSGMLRIPVLWIMIYAVIICAVSLSFLDPTLANHLESFHLTPTIVGLLFLLCGGIYTITAPFWGIIIDKFSCNKLIMFFGAAAVVISMVIIGPSPFLNAEKNLTWIAIALSVLGVAAGALYIPTFQTSIDAVREYGYDESLQTYGCVSGIFQSAFSFGSFFGPTIGGLSVQWIGFSWTATIIALFNIVFIIIMLFFYAVCNRLNCCRRPNSSSST